MIMVISILIAASAVVIGLASLKKPEWALLLVVSLFAFEQVLQSYFPALFARSWLTNVAFGLLAIAAVIARTTRGEKVFAGYPNKALLCIVALYLFEYIAVAWAPQPGYIIGVMRQGFPYLILMLAISPLLIDGVKSYERFVVSLLIVGTAICLLIMFNPKAGFGGSRFTISLGEEMGEKRGSPLAIATLGGMVAIAAALIRFQGAGRLMMILRLAGFFAGLGLAILSGSRGQVLGVIATCVMFYPMARKVKNIQQFFTVVIGVVALAGLLYVTWQFFVGSENEARWTSEKLLEGGEKRFDKVWDIFSVYMVSPHMWIQGLGPGAYTYITNAGYTHNVLVEITCELGLIGLTLYGTAIWCCYREGRNVFEAYREDSVRRATVTVLLAITFYQFFLSLKQGSAIGWPGPMMYFLIASKVFVAEQRRWDEEGFPVLDIDDEEWEDPYDIVDPESAADYGDEYGEYEYEDYDDSALGYA